MGLEYNLFINRECMDCVHGEYDLVEQKYFCLLRGDFRAPDDTAPCEDMNRGDSQPE